MASCERPSGYVGSESGGYCFCVCGFSACAGGGAEVADAGTASPCPAGAAEPRPIIPALTPFYAFARDASYPLIRATIEEQLRFEPETPTRNRKQLERPIDLGARWELRLGPDNRFRVFYRVDSEQRHVRILATAVKEGNRVFLGGEEVEL